MEVTLTVEQLANAYTAMERIGQMEGFASGPALWVARNLRNWKPDFEDYQKARLSLFQKYGEPVGEGEQAQLRIKPENMDKFSLELRSILDVPVSVNVTVRDAEYLGQKELEPENLFRLEFIIKSQKPELDQVEHLRYSELTELLAALSSMATFKLPIELSWWVVSLLEQAESKVLELNLMQLKARQDGGDIQAVLNILNTERFPIRYTPRSAADFDGRLPGWKPVMFTPMIFALTD